MTDKEFKRLSRSQLIEIIYQFQLKQDELVAENEKLQKELEDRRIRIGKAGNVADAALEIHNVMQAAQDAVEHFKEEMQFRVNREYQRIIDEAKKEADEIILKAKKEADPTFEEEKDSQPDAGVNE
ncbi:MAG: hypothetical protein IKU42_00870 [Oscillospiraceae bacterium]|nr:hypothetical protein [Oscillospiraceae bacterium]